MILCVYVQKRWDFYTGQMSRLYYIWMKVFWYTWQKECRVVTFSVVRYICCFISWTEMTDSLRLWASSPGMKKVRFHRCLSLFPHFLYAMHRLNSAHQKAVATHQTYSERAAPTSLLLALAKKPSASVNCKITLTFDSRITRPNKLEILGNHVLPLGWPAVTWFWLPQSPVLLIVHAADVVRTCYTCLSACFLASSFYWNG